MTKPMTDAELFKANRAAAKTLMSWTVQHNSRGQIDPDLPPYFCTRPGDAWREAYMYVDRWGSVVLEGVLEAIAEEHGQANARKYAEALELMFSVYGQRVLY